MTLYDEMRIANAHKGQRYSSGAKAVQDQRAVGALGASNEVKSVFKEWTTDQDIDDPSKTIPGTKRTYKDPKGTLQEGGRIEREEQEWGPEGQPKASDQLKIYNKSKVGNNLASAANKFMAAAPHLQSILQGADKLFGEGDIIGTGSGYAMQQGGWNPEMYIGRGMGY